MSMTAGAVGSLVIYDYLLGLDWTRNKLVRGGMNWVTNHFTVGENPGITQFGWNRKCFQYYYLYALERLGVLYGTEYFGRHRWYTEGAKLLLEEQKPDGFWNTGTWDGDTAGPKPVWDTCFALLFLKRATRPLTDVPSIDERSPKKK
jgi:hypothetical protein